MRLERLSDTQLDSSIKALQHAKTFRQGGLLVTEQKALDDLLAEAERRADIAYCKSHDC